MNSILQAATSLDGSSLQLAFWVLIPSQSRGSSLALENKKKKKNAKERKGIVDIQNPHFAIRHAKAPLPRTLTLGNSRTTWGQATLVRGRAGGTLHGKGSGARVDVDDGADEGGLVAKNEDFDGCCFGGDGRASQSGKEREHGANHDERETATRCAAGKTNVARASKEQRGERERERKHVLFNGNANSLQGGGRST